MSRCSVGVVTAMASEAKALTRQPPRPRELMPLGDSDMLWLSGMGQDAARQGAMALVDAGATALAVFGVAGALAPGVRCGTLFCPAWIIDDQGRDYAATPSWRATLATRLANAALPVMMDGSLLSLPSPLFSAASKTAMRGRTLSAAVDTESAAVAAVAAERQLPFVVLRAIIDERDDDIPSELQAAIDAWGRPQPLRMLAMLGRRPGLLIRLPGLARRMGRATRALRAAASAAGTNLGCEPRRAC